MIASVKEFAPQFSKRRAADMILIQTFTIQAVLFKTQPPIRYRFEYDFEYDFEYAGRESFREPGRSSSTAENSGNTKRNKHLRKQEPSSAW